MSLRMKTYRYLVNRVPAIQKEYWKRRKLHTKPVERAGDWCVLLAMNLAWGIGCRWWAADEQDPDKNRVLPKVPESSLHKKECPEKFAKKLLEYDVISFDVFDTLLLRPFERPADLFHMAGAKLGYLDFARLRSEAEGKARQLKYQKEKTYEVTLEEIWDVMESDVGIPRNMGMAAEIETEFSYCFGNPYMLEVFRNLKAERKKNAACHLGRVPTIICTSDMYFSSDIIRRMLQKCGFDGIEKIYVSCEQGASKSRGDLYQKITEEFSLSAEADQNSGGQQRKITFVHTGDNLVSDAERAKEAGWKANHYPNVNDLGEWYRARDMSMITGSLYRGIVNAQIYNGLQTYSREYELGFIYGGLFVTGYCQWIHRYVMKHGIDKILFLARDGDILCKAYRKMYPEEAGSDRTEYVYWSRLAATKLGAEYFKYDYFRRFLHHKVNQGYTLKQVFKGMELSDMLAGCIVAINSESDEEDSGNGDRVRKMTAGKTSVTENEKLTSTIAEKIEKYLKKNWMEVLNHYRDQRKAAGEYYGRVLQGHKKVVAADVGWAGSGAVVLQYLIRHEWGLDCEIIGLLAGTNSIHNGMEKDTAEGLRAVGKQASYLYSQEHNRDVWKFHNAAKGHNLLWELLLSSEEGSLRGFYPKRMESGAGGNGIFCEIRLGVFDEKHAGVTVEIQRGILDFMQLWNALTPGDRAEAVEISGRDVYAAVRICCDEANRQEMEKLFDKEGI